MAEIRWTQEAAEWPENIPNYLKQHSPSGSAKVLRGIYAEIQSLETHPELGHLLKITERGEIRLLIHKNYRIAYRVLDEGVIEIVGIFHHALNIEDYL